MHWLCVDRRMMATVGRCERSGRSGQLPRSARAFHHHRPFVHKPDSNTINNCDNRYRRSFTNQTHLVAVSPYFEAHHGARQVLPRQDREHEARDHSASSSSSTIRSATKRLQFESAITQGRARAVATTWVICRRGSEGDEHEKGLGQSPSRRQIR